LYCLAVFFFFFSFLNLLIHFPVFQLYLYNIIHVPLSHLTPCHPALHKSWITHTPSKRLHNSDIHPSHVWLQLLPKCPLLQAVNNIKKIKTLEFAIVRPLIYRIMFYRNTWTQWRCLWKYFIVCLYNYFS
jgi:hypothetical protein